MSKNFTETREGRVIKILTEFLENKHLFEERGINNTIVMFGSARIKNQKEATSLLEQAIAEKKNIDQAKNQLEISVYYEKARALANKLAIWSKKFPENDKYYICTGGGPGIMEAANKGAFDAGEKTFGLNINLPFEQDFNQYLNKDNVFMFQYFFLRKFWFSYFAKAIVVFPGGFGTLDELFENLTLLQTHKMVKKIPLVLFGKEFFNNFVNTDILKKYSLISDHDSDLIFYTDDVEEAFNHIVNFLEKNEK